MQLWRSTDDSCYHRPLSTLKAITSPYNQTCPDSEYLGWLSCGLDNVLVACPCLGPCGTWPDSSLCYHRCTHRRSVGEDTLALCKLRPMKHCFEHELNPAPFPPLYNPHPEFVYTSTVTSVKAGSVATIDGLWKNSMSCMFINMGVYIGLTFAAMVLPPWRSARAQLHTRVHKVLMDLASRFDAAAEGEAARPCWVRFQARRGSVIILNPDTAFIPQASRPVVKTIYMMALSFLYRRSSIAGSYSRASALLMTGRGSIP